MTLALLYALGALVTCGLAGFVTEGVDRISVFVALVYAVSWPIYLPMLMFVVGFRLKRRDR